MASVRGAHLVGSLTYPDAESAMIAAAENLGGLLQRIPDGEPGDRFHWIMFQPDVLARAEGIERVGDESIMIGHLDRRPLRIADGWMPRTSVFPSSATRGRQRNRTRSSLGCAPRA